MDALLGKLDEFDVMGRLCVGCAGASALFLIGLFVLAVAWGIRRDRRPPNS